MSRTSSMRFRCNCGGKLKVVETRAINEAVYRTRRCEDCEWRFTTIEQPYEGLIPNLARRAAEHERTGVKV